MPQGNLTDTDVLAAINATQINGQPITAAEFATFLQYGVLAMQRDSATAKASIQQTQNTATANTGATALAGFQNQATAAQTAIASLLGNQSF